MARNDGLVLAACAGLCVHALRGGLRALCGRAGPQDALLHLHGPLQGARRASARHLAHGGVCHAMPCEAPSRLRRDGRSDGPGPARCALCHAGMCTLSRRRPGACCRCPQGHAQWLGRHGEQPRKRRVHFPAPGCARR